MKDYKALSNERLLVLCIEKNPLAWFEFIRRFKKLVSYAVGERLRRWNYIYDVSDIEDICQEIFLSIWEKDLLKKLKNTKSIVPWLAILSANRAISFFRKKSQLPPKTISIFEKDKTLDLVDTHNPGPLEKVIFKESFNNIISIIKKLSPVEKNVLRLHLLYKNTYTEIARLLKMPIGSVCSIVKRAKTKIKHGLKK